MDINKTEKIAKSSSPQRTFAVSSELHNSSTISEVDILSLSHDDEWNSGFDERMMDTDELPTFEIRAFSPMSRSPSPIDFDTDNPPEDFVLKSPASKLTDPQRNDAIAGNSLCEGFISLNDVIAQISPPSDNKFFGHTVCRLETIHEDAILEIKNRRLSIMGSCSDRNNCKIVEKDKFAKRPIAGGKENQSGRKRRRLLSDSDGSDNHPYSSSKSAT